MDLKPNYGLWRVDKEKEEGFSYELISSDTRNIIHETDLDSLDAIEYPGVDTLLKALKRNFYHMPKNGFFGTRIDNHY